MCLGYFLIVLCSGKEINRYTLLHVGSLPVVPAWVLSVSLKASSTYLWVSQPVGLSNSHPNNQPSTTPSGLEYVPQQKTLPLEKASKDLGNGPGLFGADGQILGTTHLDLGEQDF